MSVFLCILLKNSKTEQTLKIFDEKSCCITDSSACFCHVHGQTASPRHPAARGKDVFQHALDQGTWKACQAYYETSSVSHSGIEMICRMQEWEVYFLFFLSLIFFSLFSFFFFLFFLIKFRFVNFRYFGHWSSSIKQFIGLLSFRISYFELNAFHICTYLNIL